MYNFNELKVGADPEVFLLSKKDKIPISAEGLIGGTKQEPLKIFDIEGFAVQEDNVAAEFNIPPASNARDFSNSINKALKYLANVADNADLQLAFYSSLHFSAAQLATPHAQQLGCDPDFNAWTSAQNPRPVCPPSLRTAAGHVHLGWREPMDNERTLVLKALDLFLGVPSIMATKKNERRSLYGKAGACRMKPYGVEYRTLDNFWIADHENRKFVFDQCYNTTKAIQSLGYAQVQEILDDFEEAIVTCINDHDMNLAAELCSKFNIPLFPITSV